MSDDSSREHLYRAIADHASDGLPDGALLMGWVVIAETMAPDGERWLSMIDGDARNRPLPQWHRAGYLHDCLHDPGDALSEDSGTDCDGEA